MLNQKLVHAIAGGKHRDRGSAEWSVIFGLTRGHGWLLLRAMVRRGWRRGTSNLESRVRS
jgi:hypothetical protein